MRILCVALIAIFHVSSFAGNAEVTTRFILLSKSEFGELAVKPLYRELGFKSPPIDDRRLQKEMQTQCISKYGDKFHFSGWLEDRRRENKDYIDVLLEDVPGVPGKALRFVK